jgi:putative transcriptional regulator
MKLKAGILLKSTESLNGSFFEGVTILITEYNDNGAMGFVISQCFDRQLNELVEFKHSPGFPLYDGGPVDKEHLFFIHRRPDIIEDSIEIGNGICSGGNFKQAVRAINENRISTEDIKIFIGYCGWNKGELEAEIEEGSWIMTTFENVFS